MADHDKKKLAFIVVEDEVEAAFEIANALSSGGIAEKGITTFWATYGAKVSAMLFRQITEAGYEVVAIIMDHHFRLEFTTGDNVNSVRRLRQDILFPGPIIASSLSRDGNKCLLDAGANISIHQRLPEGGEHPNKAYAVDILFSYLETGKLE